MVSRQQHNHGNQKQRSKRSAPEEQSPKHSSTSGKWKRPLIIVGILGFLFFLPTIVAQTPLLSYLVDRAAEKSGAQVSVGSASLGWFSPVVAHDVTIDQPELGRSVSVERVRISKSLISLIQDQSQLGTVELLRPTVNLIVKALESNPVVDPVSNPDAKSNVNSLPTFRILVKQGTVHVEDPTTSTKWSLLELDAEMNRAADISGLEFAVKTNLQLGRQIGQVQATGNYDLQTGQISVDCNTQNVSLQVADSAATYLGLGFRASGNLNGRVHLTAADNQYTLQTNLTASNFQCFYPDVLGQQVVQENQLRAVGTITINAGQIVADQFTIHTDQGNLTAHGNIPVSFETGGSLTALASSLTSNQPWHLHANVDIARLAAKYPALLSIKQDTQLTSGQVTLQIQNNPQAAVPVLQVIAKVSDIGATVQGRPANWNQPLDFNLSLVKAGNQLQLQNVTCQSSFVSAQASGSAANAQIAMTVDLDRLVADLSQFIDFGSTQLSGKVTGNFHLRSLPESQVALGGQFSSEHLQITTQSVPRLVDLNPKAQFELLLNMPAQQAIQVAAAQAVLSFGQDAFTVQLAQPIDPQTVTTWPLRARLQGNVQSWQARLGSFFPLEGWNFAGEADVIAKLQYAANSIAVESLNATVNHFRFVGTGLDVNESTLQVTGSGQYDFETGSFQSKEFTLVGAAVSARGTELFYGTPDGQDTAALQGKLAYRADLVRVANWITTTEPPTLRPSGEIAGTVSINSQTNATVAIIDGTITNWKLASRTNQPAASMIPVATSGRSYNSAPMIYETIWEEPSVQMKTQISLDTKQDRIQLSDTQLVTSAFQLTAAGEIQQASLAPTINLKGQANYDWQKLNPLIKLFAGEGITLTGKHSSPFTLNGPLFAGGTSTAGPAFAWLSPQLTGSAAIGFDQANLFGIPIGKFETTAMLQNGIIKPTPLDAVISGGRLTVSPTAYLLNSPAVMTLDRGRIAQNLEITPAMCSNWLKYVAPLFADATRVEGKFSLDLQEGQFPLTNPLAGRASGVLIIHGAQVRPGPASEGLVRIAKQVESLIKGRPFDSFNPAETVLMYLPDQQVPFQMVGGKVYHQGLKMQVGQVQLITSGNVSADQKLEMLATIPIDPQMIQNNPLLANVQGQMIQIPIRGTLSSPKIDKRVLEQVGKQAIEDAARDLIDKGLNRGLRELFGN
ncbi:MAG: hypothetical protein COA78_01400 [Blastopirellula sp.]|nr:MAG: hypothetical protein COA78_01400 [Blastopirellula sp.]